MSSFRCMDYNNAFKLMFAVQNELFAGFNHRDGHRQGNAIIYKSNNKNFCWHSFSYNVDIYYIKNLRL